MGIILALVAVILFIVGITFSMIRAGIDNSPKHQVKAKAEYQKKKREQNWDENSGPSESEFVADYLDKKKARFLDEPRFGSDRDTFDCYQLLCSGRLAQTAKCAAAILEGSASICGFQPGSRLGGRDPG